MTRFLTVTDVIMVPSQQYPSGPVPQQSNAPPPAYPLNTVTDNQYPTKQNEANGGQ